MKQEAPHQRHSRRESSDLQSGEHVNDTDHETRGFPPIEPIDAPPEMARFMAAMRRLQDIAVSTAPDGALWTDGAKRIEEPVRAARSPPGAAGRRSRRPSPSPARSRPSSDAAVDPHRLRARRRHHGRALQPLPRRRKQRRARRGHPAVLRLAFRHDRVRRGPAHQPDRLSACRLPQDHPDRRTPDLARAIDRLDGRKAFITATMTDADGTVLSEANGLMIKLLPHQP